MKALRTLTCALALALALTLAGCAATPAPNGAPVAGMGMGSGESVDMASSVIAAARNASMGPVSFDASTGVITVTRVTAPEDGWIVVRSATAPGGVLGSAPVRTGQNRSVRVSLKTIDGARVLVALHVDRGARGTLEFDPSQLAAPLDKAVIVEGVPIESSLILAGWGAPAIPNSALIMVEDQKAGPTLLVAYLIVPGPSWIEVRLLEKGVPTRRIGVISRSAGEFHRVDVPIAGARPKDRLIITAFADRGIPGVFEPASGDPFLGIDQPWVSAGSVICQRITLR
jgi:hypothetical protein